MSNMHLKIIMLAKITRNIKFDGLMDFNISVQPCIKRAVRCSRNGVFYGS